MLQDAFFVINGSHFHPYLENAIAHCSVQDPLTNNQVMRLPVSYYPNLDVNSVHCMFEGANFKIGNMNATYVYNLVYEQPGRVHTSAYQIVILPRPRLHSIASRLVTSLEQIPIYGVYFDPRVNY